MFANLSGWHLLILMILALLFFAATVAVAVVVVLVVRRTAVPGRAQVRATGGVVDVGEAGGDQDRAGRGSASGRGDDPLASSRE